jgi:hypothetical protein
VVCVVWHVYGGSLTGPLYVCVRPSIKDRLEEEKELVKVEAEKIAEGYSADVFRVVMNKNNAELCEAP